MDKEIEELENMLKDKKQTEAGVEVEVEEKPAKVVDKKKKVDDNNAIMICIQKPWLAIVLSIFAYLVVGLVPILIALISH